MLLNPDDNSHPINTVTNFFYSKYDDKSDSEFSFITLPSFSSQMINKNKVDYSRARHEEKLKQNSIFNLPLNTIFTDSFISSSLSSNQNSCLEFNIEDNLILYL